LGRLVEELLDLARLDSGQASLKRGPVEIGTILTAIHEKLRLKAEAKGIQLEDHSGSNPTMIGDGDRLAQVFTNLIDNAIKHTDSGGVIRVRNETDSAWITVHVEDNGSGIPPEELSRIFERFYQLDKARAASGPRGAGLGLAISKEIVEAHGGSLTAKSVPGRGSRFTVRLPFVQPDDETLARPKA
jgi:two-component system sensor histidine kinase ResE